ncbi:hypothetical protein SAMN05216261_0231 [Algibacter luteus]|jgi:hypothetical protein|uniref:Uncharacterized protein n=1 Tax=Algibacter luteus TaxID=1178825 RepID=A0A1M6A5I8_9FLAO|nr:hypothetical protein SAMN05216261_0231 [Algibacter luteus]
MNDKISWFSMKHILMFMVCQFITTKVQAQLILYTDCTDSAIAN